MRKFCVYAHSVSGKVIYIGMGSHRRALTASCRSKRWVEAVPDGKSFEVSFLSWHNKREHAEKAEREQILRHRPPANLARYSPVYRFRNGKPKVTVTMEFPKAMWVQVRRAAKARGMFLQTFTKMALTEWLAQKGQIQ